SGPRSISPRRAVEFVHGVPPVWLLNGTSQWIRGTGVVAPSRMHCGRFVAHVVFLQIASGRQYAGSTGPHVSVRPAPSMHAGPPSRHAFALVSGTANFSVRQFAWSRSEVPFA